MHNHHLGLSQLADQRSSDHHAQAAQVRLVRGARPPRRRRRRAEMARRWWQLARRPAVVQPVSRPQHSS